MLRSIPVDFMLVISFRKVWIAAIPYIRLKIQYCAVERIAFTWDNDILSKKNGGVNRFLSFLMILIEGSRVPVDDPTTHLE